LRHSAATFPVKTHETDGTFTAHWQPLSGHRYPTADQHQCIQPPREPEHKDAVHKLNLFVTVTCSEALGWFGGFNVPLFSGSFVRLAHNKGGT